MDVAFQVFPGFMLGCCRISHCLVGVLICFWVFHTWKGWGSFWSFLQHSERRWKVFFLVFFLDLGRIHAACLSSFHGGDDSSSFLMPHDFGFLSYL